MPMVVPPMDHHRHMDLRDQVDLWPKSFTGQSDIIRFSLLFSNRPLRALGWALLRENLEFLREMPFWTPAMDL